MKLSVALIYGGEGCERDVSKNSRNNLRLLIDNERFEVIDVYISDNGEWFLLKDGDAATPTFPMAKDGKHGLISGTEIVEIDVAIPCLHGNFGEDGIICGALTAAHIPTVSEDVYASSLAADKAYTKTVCEHLGIPTAAWRLSVGESAEEALSHSESLLTYPMFIKPARLGSSIGACPVRQRDDFIPAFNKAKHLAGDRILVEKEIKIKHELECAVFGAKERKILPGGTVYSNGIFYDFKAKYNSGDLTAAVSEEYASSPTAKKAAEYAERLADFIGINMISRIDFFVAENDDIYFNEINTFPGMTKTSLYPRMAELLCGGKGFINELILSALNAGRF